MRFTYENPELQQAIESAGSLDDLEAALQRLSKLVPTFVAPEIRGRQMFAPGLDSTVPVIARKLGLKEVALEKSNDNVCILATQFNPTGGHSKVAADISRLIGAERVTVVFTDLYQNLRYKQLLKKGSQDHFYHRRATVLLTAPTMAEKIVELYMLLAAIRPTRIFLMGNHMDMVSVAGVWPFRSVTEFVHHADHMPVIGATLPFSVHADLTYMCHRACREAGVGAEYVGMTAAQRDLAPARPRPANPQPLRFATCGALHKYRQPALFTWADFAIAALGFPGSEFIHIGPTDEAFETEMGDALSAANIDPSRYRFLGTVPDLPAALIDLGVDVYVASYPDTGGRANLEAMVSGLAPIVMIPKDIGELLQFDIPLDQWVRISEPAQVSDAVAQSLELSAQLKQPTARAALSAELARFETYVANPHASPTQPR